MSSPARLRQVAAAIAVLLLLASCESEEPAPDKEPAPGKAPAPIEVFRASDVPDGSSGSLVATLDGKVVSCHGWGQTDRTNGPASGCGTVYDIGSVSKQFTAAAVLRLQMQGRLRVADPVDRFFDGVPEDKRRITVRHLLTHTAGLVDSLGDDYDPLTRQAMITGALSSGLRTRPGARYHYSNVGYSLLAAIIEKASGMGYEDYLAQELFAPAGMSQTGYVLPDWDPGDVAVEYDAQDRPHGSPVRPSVGRGRAVLEPPRQRWVALHRPRHGPVAPGPRGQPRAGRAGEEGVVPATRAGGARR